MKPSNQRHWLITAFEPFAGRSINNSQTTLNEIKSRAMVRESDQVDWPYHFHYLTLPTLYDRCAEVLIQEVARLESTGIKLEGVLSIGEGADAFKLETQANNLDDVENYPDNAGISRVQEVIFSDLDAQAKIPLRFPFEMFSKIRTSTSPGFFICNHLCAKMGREFADAKKPFFGFIHVPKTGEGGMFTADLCAEVILVGFSKMSG